jgi:hypothetical protein
MSDRASDVPTGPTDTSPATGPDGAPVPPDQAGQAPGGRKRGDDRGEGVDDAHGEPPGQQ